MACIDEVEVYGGYILYIDELRTEKVVNVAMINIKRLPTMKVFWINYIQD